MTIKNFDRYYDPPDDPEVPICEFCGLDMDFDADDEPVCNNPICPEKFNIQSVSGKIAKEMAERIVSMREDIDQMHARLRQAEGHKRQMLELVSELKTEILVLKNSN